MSKTPQKRLGRGLSALIPPPDQSATAQGDTATATAPDTSPTIPIDRIRPNPYQPRQEIRPEELQSLADSIKTNGLIQPVIVRPKVGGLYELIAGERRWRSSQMAGLATIPAIVRDATDEEMLEIALVENIFREDLNAIDRALAYRRYCDEFGLSADDVAQRVSEDRTTVTNYLRLLELPAEVKDMVTEGRLSMGHARCLLAIKSASDLVQVARQAVNLGLSVRALEKLVRDRVNARATASQSNAGTSDAKRPQIRSLEEAFVRVLGTKVEIQESRRKGSGKIIIRYSNLDDFDRVAERLGIET
jgi:ParB family chromosome partitioning protein